MNFFKIHLMINYYFTHYIDYLYKPELITKWRFSVTTYFLTHALPILLNYCRSTHLLVSYALLQTHAFSLFLRHALKHLAKGRSLLVQPNNGILYHYTSLVLQLPTTKSFKTALKTHFFKYIFKIKETAFLLMIN